MSKAYKNSIKTLVYVFFAVNAVIGDETNTLSKDIKDNKNHSDVANLQDVIINEIMNKVGNLTINTWANLTIDEKSKHFNNIKEKLKNAAAVFGHKGNTYVEIIMEGIKIMSLDREKKINDNVQLKPLRHALEIVSLNITDPNYNIPKEELIKTIKDRIKKIVNKAFGNAVNIQEKKAILEKIRKKIAILVRKMEEDHNYINSTISYEDIIMEGIDVMMQKNHMKDTRRNENPSYKNINDNRLNSEVKDGVPTVSTTFPSSIKPSKSGTCDCKCIVNNVCEKIKNVNTVICPFDHSIIKLEQVCDNAVDCPDRFDEKNCQQKALQFIEKINQLIKEVEYGFPQHCYSEESPDVPLSQQKTSLVNVLQTEINFINKYSDKYKKGNNYTTQNTAHDVLAVVYAIALAFEGAFCISEERHVEDEINEVMHFDYHQAMTDTFWSPRLCSCDGESCTKPNCKDACKRVCWNKYILDKWVCDAIENDSSVTLDVICDGKIDCYDESDEIGCSRGESIHKFEAREIFKNILEILSTKTGSSDYALVRPLLINLHSYIKKLEKISTKEKNNNFDLKSIRDKSFSTLSLIYDKVIEQSTAKDESVDVHKFLTSLNNKLVEAIKRSGTGNEPIVPAGSCYCRNDKCAAPTCSKQCQRACTAESEITKYSCDRNIFVPITALCDGKPNCSNGNDEAYCSKDVCRSHHLKLLRHKIKDFGYKHEGTSIGEALKSWKSKINGTLKVNDKKERLLKKNLLVLVSSILKELVMAFGSLEINKNNHENVLKVFSQIAQDIIEILKDCK